MYATVICPAQSMQLYTNHPVTAYFLRNKQSKPGKKVSCWDIEPASAILYSTPLCISGEPLQGYHLLGWHYLRCSHRCGDIWTSIGFLQIEWLTMRMATQWKQSINRLLAGLCTVQLAPWMVLAAISAAIFLAPRLSEAVNKLICGEGRSKTNNWDKDNVELAKQSDHHQSMQ
jgi:hypothetical protein